MSDINATLTTDDLNIIVTALYERADRLKKISHMDNLNLSDRIIALAGRLVALLDHDAPTMSYQEEITYVAQEIVKASHAFNNSQAHNLTAAYSAAYLLGYKPQSGVTNDLVQSAMTESEFMR